MSDSKGKGKELLQWEADLKRREADIRRREEALKSGKLLSALDLVL